MNFTIGSDPEVFITKEILGNIEYFPAIEILSATKDLPEEIDSKGRSILVDNVMLEFNTLPVNNKKDFVKEHFDFLEVLKSRMQQKQCNISTKSFVEFKAIFLTHPVSREFGCSPDYSAYSKRKNKAPSANFNFRSAAGHIHVGYENHNKKSNIELIKLLDLTLAVPSVLDDVDRDRRKLYGKAGCYRHKKQYGFEFRTLSNYWIFTEYFLNKIYDGVQKAFDLYEDDFKISEELENDIVDTINNYNESKAEKLIKEYLIN